MANPTLDRISKQEIRSTLDGLTGKELSNRIQELADFYEVSQTRLYAITKDLRPARKTRADKGTRKADFEHDEGLQFASELVISRNLDPYWALRTAQDNGFDIQISLGTFQRYLRENELSLKQRKKPIRAYRRWEASAPGELFQFDISGVKERWFDRQTRSILKVTPLEVSKNHANDDPNRCPIWKFVLLDDYSRMTFIRFYAVSKPNSTDIADFLMNAFRTLGVPQALYTDNDKVIISKMMRRAERILNDAFAESGGFKLTQHLPGNAQASGKVERTHQIFESFEKLIGVKKYTPSLEDLNLFTERACHFLNYDKKHTSTRQIPVVRWQSISHTLRIPTDAALDAAFKCKEFVRTINADLSISVDGSSYQIPREAPFIDWITKKILVLWPAADADWISICNPADLHYSDVWFTLDRKHATTDAAGDFKAVADNKQQQAIKRLKQQAKERRAAIESPDQDIITPGFDTPLSTQLNQPISFPKPRLELTQEQLAAVAPGAVASQSNLTYWAAFDLLREEELLEASEQDKDWLRSIFGDRDAIAEADLRTALTNRHRPADVLTFERRKVS